MLIDLIDKLISRVIDLLKEEQRIKKSLHDEFVIPLMIQFEEIYKNYIQTFIKYRESIIHGASRLSMEHPLFEEIKKDSLSSDSMRVKLGSLWRVLNERRDNSNELMGLLESIARYLEFAIESPVPRNIARASITSDLLGASKKQACSVVEEKIEQLQGDYSRVQEKYQELKLKLVK
jgi:hypothetical protein